MLLTSCKLLAAGMSMLAVAAVAAPVPRFDHVVVVIMENHSAAEIYGNGYAPYINGTLIAGGAKFNSSYGVTHPSQPNYIAMFSGSTQSVIDDSCPHSFSTGNLGQQLIDAGFTFAQYSEGLPATGDASCTYGLYARKHNAAADFPVLPASANQPFANFASIVANATLPTVSFVAPDLCNDMHGAGSCSGANLIALGDTWLQNNLPQYLSSPAARNGLLIVTWDEDDSSGVNQIPTIFFGAHVKPGFASAAIVNHYNLLRTLEEMYGLAPLGAAALETPITDVWDDVIFRDGFQ
jgi:phospholipase C